MKSIIFFNNKGGVGKTSLAFHFAYMLSELGYNTLAVDLDPQANLTTMLLRDEQIYNLFENEKERGTIVNCIENIIKGKGDIKPAIVQQINNNLNLIVGDLDLSRFEDKLSDNWTKCINRDEAAFRVVSAFYRIIQEAGNRLEAQYAIIDVGPNLGAINRVSLISADYLIIPMAADLFSIKGIKNVGFAIADWSEEWQDRYNRNPAKDLELPKGSLNALGYVIIQYNIFEKSPVIAYRKWAEKIPRAFRENILKEKNKKFVLIEEDEYCLALIKHYHSLIPMAMAVKKPIFLLKPADGAIGAHYHAVQDVYTDFENFTKKIINIINKVTDDT